jgi:hypothetical protein
MFTSLALEDMVALQFNNKVSVLTTPGTEGWFVSKDAKFIRSTNSDPFYFIRTGYARVQETGENRYKWFVKLIAGKGWTYYITFDDEGEEAFLTILPLNSSGKGTQTISTDYVCQPGGFTPKFSNPESPIKAIFVNGAFYTGGDAAFPTGHTQNKSDRGASGFLFTNKHLLAAQNHWMVCTRASGIQRYHLDIDDYYANSFYYLRNTVTNEEYIEYQLQLKNIPGAKIRIERENLLYIDAGSTNPYGYRIDLSNELIMAWEPSTGFNHTDLCFIGNYADMLFKNQIFYDPVTGQPSLYSFDADVISGNLFRNIAPLMNDNSNNMLDVNLSTTDIDLLKDIHFDGSIPELHNTDWAIREAEFDDMKDESKLLLSKL